MTDNLIVHFFINTAAAFTNNLWLQAVTVASVTIITASLITLLLFYLIKKMTKRTIWEFDK